MKKNIDFEKLRTYTKLLLCWIEEEWKINIQKKLIDENSEWNQLKIENHLILIITYFAIHNSHIIFWEMIYCEIKYVYNQNKNWIKMRNDIILLKYSEKKEVHIMINHWIIQLKLLFSFQYWDEELRLTFIQFFEIIDNAHSNHDMYKVQKTSWFNVMKINMIERKMHLISYYRISLITEMTLKNSLSILKVYEKFFINNHIDFSIFNTIYWILHMKYLIWWK